MIVSLATLKLALGIAADDASEDDSLQLLESLASAWVEKATERRWQAPVARVEYLWGSGTRTLYLNGHPAINSGAEPPEVLPVVLVRDRNLLGDWTEVLEGFELRGETLIRTDGYIWHPTLEYEVSYFDGWTEAPGDIQALVLDLVRTSRASLEASVGEAALKSESLGDYSYSLDAAVTAASVTLSAGSLAVLNRRRRMHV